MELPAHKIVLGGASGLFKARLKVWAEQPQLEFHLTVHLAVTGMRRRGLLDTFVPLSLGGHMCCNNPSKATKHQARVNRGRSQQHQKTGNEEREEHGRIIMH